jgi:hypothetical protein
MANWERLFFKTTLTEFQPTFQIVAALRNSGTNSMRETARYKRKCKIERFAEFAQSYAVRLSEIVRKARPKQHLVRRSERARCDDHLRTTDCISRDKQRMSSVKCWEIIADNLRKAGLSWGAQVR